VTPSVSRMSEGVRMIRLTVRISESGSRDGQGHGNRTGLQNEERSRDCLRAAINRVSTRLLQFGGRKFGLHE
jgi:hypothetical protein